MPATFPRTGFFWTHDPLSPEIVRAIVGVRIDERGWARLRAGGVAALPLEYKDWAQACCRDAGTLADRGVEITRLYKAMLDAVVPPAIGVLGFAATIGLALFSVGFLWPDQRRWAFGLAFLVVLAMVIWATVRALWSSRRQRALQDELLVAVDALTALREEAERPRQLLLALGIDSDESATSGASWRSVLADPERLLIVPRGLIGSADWSWLERLSRARAIVVDGEPPESCSVLTQVSFGEALENARNFNAPG